MYSSTAFVIKIMLMMIGRETCSLTWATSKQVIKFLQHLTFLVVNEQHHLPPPLRYYDFPVQ
jgi:hypothetical protein